MSVEGKAAERVGLSAIFLVTSNRVTDPLRVSPDLILATCLKLELHLGVWLAFYYASLKCLAMSRGKLPSVALSLLA